MSNEQLSTKVAILETNQNNIMDAKEKHRKYALAYHNKNKNKVREYAMFRKFGITISEYNNIYIKQNGVCAICFNPEIITGKNKIIKRLSLDHCHTTGKIRGLLCHKCNTAIGLMNDSAILLDKAKKYLLDNL
jgi:hypothetical protein